MSKGPKRRLARWIAGLLAVAILVFVADGWTSFGRRADGARRARMESSPQWKDGHFENPEPLENDLWKMLVRMIDASPDRSPAQPVPLAPLDRQTFEEPAGLRVTWFGHSSMLVEIDGHRVLTDPAWSERASRSAGSVRRWYQVPLRLDELPTIDAVVISHDHYDHLTTAPSSPSPRRVRRWFCGALGWRTGVLYSGAHHEPIGGEDAVRLDIVAVPARHASGRVLFDHEATLWAGYALVGAEHRAYFSGDTGLFPAMREIGERYGPFDVTLIETGQYDPAWPDWHIGPEQAVTAHRMVKGKVMFPVHWGLFALAYHGWTEPIERTRAAAKKAGVTVVTPKPGQSVEPGAPPPFERWWPDVPWKTGQEEPVVSTKMPRAK